MAVKNQTHPETKLSTKSKSSEFSFNLLIKSTNFIFYSIKIRLEMAEKNQTENQINQIVQNPLSLYFLWVESACQISVS